ncbi:retrovirus-related pol polyprotein from transposon TNT 1-94, partial [Tanacetum coccineum]
FAFFEVAGQIVKVEYAIISEKFTGYMLIHFATHDAARKALEVSEHKMLGRVIRIEAPKDKVACRDGMKNSGGAWVCSAVFKAQFRRTSLTGFPARSVRSSNAIALDSPCLLVLITEMSQSRQHESCKSPTAELFDVDSGRISIRHYEY